jgi:type IV pilus assembly protein PilN
MIKINLLPVKRKKKPKPVPPFVIAAVLLLTASAIASFYVSYYFKEKIGELEDQKTSKTAEIARLDERIKEVQDFEALNQKATERKNIIEQLTATQSVPVKILDEMSMRLTEAVWLTSMDITSGKIDILGFGFSNDDIVAFVQSLKGSTLFQDATLLETSQTTTDGVQTYTFKITMKGPA